jgi:hypothetical protein
MEALCACVAQSLCVDGLVVHDEPLSDELMQGRPSSRAHNVYRGAYLSQRHLAEYVCHVAGGPNPVAPNRHMIRRFFDPSINYDVSQHFGHLPVHTCSSSFTQKVVSFLMAFGVDDDLAHFLHAKVLEVRSSAEADWLKSTVGELNLR